MSKEKPATKRPRYYIAYGSNLNLRQMQHRCPTAEVIGTTTLSNWRLRFRGGSSAVATIERATGYKVPVLIWQLQPSDEKMLDRYEGYPYLYRKENLRVTVNGKRISAMVYIMNEANHSYGTPSTGYLATIFEGYEDSGFNLEVLRQAVPADYLKQVSTSTGLDLLFRERQIATAHHKSRKEDFHGTNY